MNKKLEAKLVKDFPKLYRDCYGNPRKTCMAFGFECEDGWFKLIYNLSKYLEPMIDMGDEYPIVATQVKEKFGGLRFYVSSATTEMYKAIDDAESRSYTICEICGRAGRQRNTVGWVRTLCYYCLIRFKVKRFFRNIEYKVKEVLDACNDRLRNFRNK